MQRRLAVLLALTIAVTSLGADSVNYDSDRQGHLPPDWSSPSAQKWGVRADRSAPSHPNILQGIPNETETPLALFDKVVCRDGDLSVKFRVDANRRGNSVGVVWRYQDPGNYYLLSLGPDEKSVVLRRVHNGITETLSPATGRHESAIGEIRPGEWHVVKVSFRGPKVQVFFGNRSLFTLEDSGLLMSGRTGLWVKGAGGAAFDDFRIDKKG